MSNRFTISSPVDFFGMAKTATLSFILMLSSAVPSFGQCLHDSPCDALQMTIGAGNAVQLSNVGCGVLSNEPFPPNGNCQAPGYWCDGGASKSVWAKFQVPGPGSYEISTCHNGTSFDTQIACYISSGCFYTLNGFDSYGDGWNGGILTITIDGVASDYAVQGNFFSWPILVEDGQEMTVSWSAGGWPEEVSFEMIDLFGSTILSVQAPPPNGLLLSTTTICVEEICNLSSFVMVSANDDSFGGCALPTCSVTLPECVIPASAAYNNVIENDPFCCDTGWDGQCQAAYDAQNGSCTGASAANCFYTLNGFDSFGGGWEGGFVQITVDGDSNNYALEGGSSGSFLVPVIAGAAISMSWTPGNHQDEASFQLLDSSGNEVVFINSPVPVGNVFNGVAYCVPQSGLNPNSSRAYVSCLEPGTTVWVQIDGHNGQTGSVVISVKEYLGPNEVEAIVADVTCPGGFGVPGEGSIVPVIYGWGTNYESVWTGPQGLTSTDSYLDGIEPGNYVLNATDACGNHLTETFVVEGPAPFFFENTVEHTCENESDGSAIVEISGGTAPYDVFWYGPNEFEEEGVSVQSLETGLYYMVVIDSHDCTILQGVQINSVPLPIVDLGADLTICLSDNVLLSGPAASSYTWSTGSTNSSVVIMGSDLGVGTHTISLIANNELGCPQMDELTITVETCVGVEESEFSAFSFYPNPAGDFIIATGFPQSPAVVRLLSSDGKLVYSENTGGLNSMVMEVSSLSSGLYVLELQTEGSIQREKVLISH